MEKYYMTKGERAFEVIFNGNQIESISEREPICRLGDLNEYEQWDTIKKVTAKRAFDVLGL